MSSGECRKVSPEDIQMVQNLIEQCLAHYMTKKQVIDILYRQQNIEPSFTELVWQKLEEQNHEFFGRYHLMLIVKEQITEFNKLLDRQAELMRQMDPSTVVFRAMPNGSHMPAMYWNTSENTGIVMKPKNMQHPVSANLRFNDCGPSIHSGMPRAVDMPAYYSRRIDVPSNMLLAQNSNVGTMQGMNGLAIRTAPGYLPNSRVVYQDGGNVIYQDGGNVMEAHPAFDGTNISSFSSMDSNSHQLNGTLLGDPSSFELLRQISQNICLPDLTSNSSSIGENKRPNDVSGNLGFQNVGRDL